MSHAKQLHNRRYLNDYLEIITREGLPGNVKKDLCLQVQGVVITTVQQVIEAALAEELCAYLGVVVPHPGNQSRLCSLKARACLMAFATLPKQQPPLGLVSSQRHSPAFTRCVMLR